MDMKYLLMLQQFREGAGSDILGSQRMPARRTWGILDFLGDRIEFCQIQLNYVDWTLQDAKKKVELLGSRGIPIMVMEPVRGGKLTDLCKQREEAAEKMRQGWSDRK